MLNRYIYLNESDLGDYISAIEGGSQNSRTTQTSKDKSGGVDIGVPQAKAGLNRASQNSEITAYMDTPSAQFERFRKWAIDNPEVSEWVDVLNPDEHLEGISIGEFVELEGEITIPEVIRALAKTNGMADVLGAFESLFDAPALRRSAGISDEDAEGFSGMKSVLSSFSSDPVLLGELHNSDWKVVGKLNDQFMRGEVSGNARIVGKISEICKEGEWKQLLDIPGMNLLSREQRRAMQKNGPDDPNDSSWVKGPALVLDVLAVYR